MKDYILVTDSTADLPDSVVKELDIEIIPFLFSIGTDTYFHYPDEREMTCKDFYEKIRNGAMPVTSQVNPVLYSEAFEKLLDTGKDVLYICFTTGLSSSYQSALIAAEKLRKKYPGQKLSVLDSHCASIGEGVLVYNAALKKREGLSMDELEKWVMDNRHNARHWFMVEDLFHLKRGGRVSTAEAVLGSALKIKPILSVDEEGKLVVRSKARGSNKALEYLTGKVEEEGVGLENQTIIIGHADSPEKAEKIKAMLQEKKLGKDYIITNIGPIIGTHVGPGMAAVVFMGKAS